MILQRGVCCANDSCHTTGVFHSNHASTAFSPSLHLPNVECIHPVAFCPPTQSAEFADFIFPLVLMAGSERHAFH